MLVVVVASYGGHNDGDGGNDECGINGGGNGSGKDGGDDDGDNKKCHCQMLKIYIFLKLKTKFTKHFFMVLKMSVLSSSL